jgi:two-component system phosphate regulon sensor histidine kinase PhoR
MMTECARGRRIAAGRRVHPRSISRGYIRAASVMVIVLCLLALVAWPVFGPVPALLVACAALILQLQRQRSELRKLCDWLRDPRLDAIAHSPPDWAEAYSLLARSLRSQRQQESDLSAALQRFQQAGAAVPDGLVILDEHEAIQWCNPAAQRHFGLDLARDAGHQITFVVRTPSFVEYLRASNQGEPLVLRLGRESAQPAVLSVTLVPFGDRDRLLISRDITRMEAVETTRRDFVANVSHELRTPLTVVVGFMETVLDTQELAPQLARPLGMVREQARRMQNLVEDLLTLSRLESGDNPVAEETVDIQALTRRLRDEAVALSAGRHRIELDASSSARVRGSADELQSAFGNLITNAVRYTPAGGSIRIAWTDHGPKASFEVADSGIGIDAEHLPRITERFYRVDRSRSRETGGTGLGLAIVKHVAARHSAHLAVASKVGQGSRFAIEFPASRVIRASDGDDAEVVAG